jgi:hypothetical protein
LVLLLTATPGTEKITDHPLSVTGWLKSLMDVWMGDFWASQKEINLHEGGTCSRRIYPELPFQVTNFVSTEHVCINMYVVLILDLAMQSRD